MICNAIKIIYINERIGGPPETHKTVIMDEWNFIWHQNDDQIWVVGYIEPDTRNTRFDIINNRNANNLRIFLLNHVSGTLVITDGWWAYGFLDGNESYWEQESHNKGGEIFGSALIAPLI